AVAQKNRVSRTRTPALAGTEEQKEENFSSVTAPARAKTTKKGRRESLCVADDIQFKKYYSQGKV
ncbi:MAG: hypothetical protein D3908_14210, partial [Candidatus Electrothrix sp. AUS4]|nr:hypothetical protein [Candidatus Electrothrix sp. AUS4]